MFARESWTLVLLCAFAGLAQPQPGFASADLTGTVEISAGNLVPAGTLATVTFTVINNGPDPAPDVGIGTFYFATVGFRTIEILPHPDTPPCQIRYTDFTLPPPGVSTVTVDIRPFVDLAPGGTVRCVVGIITYPEAPAVIRQRFTFGFLEDDPVPDNNFVFVDILTGTASAAIPAVSVVGGLVLVVGLAGLVLIRNRLRP